MAAKKKPTKKAPAKAAPKKKTPPKKAAAKAKAPAAAKPDASLAKVFALLGANDPAWWAASHARTGRDELARFVFLRALWLRVVEPGRLLASAGSVPEMKDLLDRLLMWVGISDLDAIIRLAQEQALENVCRVLDDHAHDKEGIGWAVFRVDEEGLPLWSLDDLKADLLQAKP